MLSRGNRFTARDYNFPAVEVAIAILPNTSSIKVALARRPGGITSTHRANCENGFKVPLSGRRRLSRTMVM
jgi:hypothetical protein